MKRARVVIVATIVLVVIALIATGIWWRTNSFSSKSSSQLATSGFIESKDTSVSFEVAGRLVALNAQEGDTVKAGDILARLDDTLLQSQKEQARANVRLANASLEQATLSVDSAKSAWQRAVDVKNSPSTLDTQVIAAQGAMNAADLNISKAKLDSDYAIDQLQTKIDYDQRVIDSLPDAVDFVTKSQIIQAELQLDTDQANLDYEKELAQSYYIPAAALAKEVASQTLQSLVSADYFAEVQANNTYQIADTNLKVAQERLNEANLSLQAIDIQLSKLSIAAPVSGIIVTRNAKIGELAQPGSAVFTIADMSQVTLDVYVSESKIGQVEIGQKAEVTVNSYPGQSFPGIVAYISPRAEYTPQNVQTQGQHLETMAFTVKINLNNPDYKLKEGVAANANILVSP